MLVHERNYLIQRTCIDVSQLIRDLPSLLPQVFNLLSDSRVGFFSDSNLLLNRLQLLIGLVHDSLDMHSSATDPEPLLL